MTKDISKIVSVQSILDSAPLIVWATDKDANFTLSLGKGLEALNLAQNELLGKNHHQIYADRADLVANVQRALKGEIFTDDTFDTGRWHSTTYFPTFDQDGNISGMSAISMDITDKKISEARLEESERRFQTMADTAPVMIWISDTGQGGTWYNKGWLNWTGRTMEEELGMGWTKNVHPQDLKGCLEVYHQNFGRKSEFRMEYRLKDKEGQYRWILDHSVPRFSANGNFEGYIAACIDIDEQKRSEEDKQHAIDVRDEFLSIASHELKTPLTTLVIQSQLQKRMMEKNDPKALDPDRIRHVMEQNERLTGRLTRLVDDMLDISRIRSGRLQIQKSPIELNRVIQDLLGRLNQNFINAGCGTPKFTGVSVVGNWDLMRIEQVLTNLLTNAMRYGKEKPVHVKLDKKDGNARIAIQDQGIGISEADTKKIFSRFERSVNANDISGLGLGLFISEQIVHAHGGNIEVKSKLGKGSTFFVTLPLEMDQ